MRAPVFTCKVCSSRSAACKRTWENLQGLSLSRFCNACVGRVWYPCSALDASWCVVNELICSEVHLSYSALARTAAFGLWKPSLGLLHLCGRTVSWNICWNTFYRNLFINCSLLSAKTNAEKFCILCFPEKKVLSLGSAGRGTVICSAFSPSYTACPSTSLSPFFLLCLLQEALN